MRKIDNKRLIYDVISLGYQIDSINDLMNIGRKHKNLIPVLLEHLSNTDFEPDKRFLIRCLSVKGFDEAVPYLLDEFRRANGVAYKWIIGNALEKIQDKSHLPDLVDIALNRTHGSAREMVVVAIGKLGGISEVPVLQELIHDDEVAGHAIAAIGHLKEPGLIPTLKPFLKHEKTWIRNEAKKAIKKLEKVYEKSRGNIH